MSAYPHPGLLIALLLFGAGMSAMAAIVAVGVAFERFGLRCQAWLASLFVCLGVYLVSIAFYHTALGRMEAIAAHKWIDAAALFNLAFLCGAIARQTDHRRNAGPVVWIITSVVLVLSIAGYVLPLGARFKNISSVDFMVFPWGERLLVLRGSTSPLYGVAELLIAASFCWIGVRLVRLFRFGERFGAMMMGFGALCVLLGVLATPLINGGKLNIVYPAGVGYLLFIFFLVSYLRRSASQATRHISKLSAAVDQAFTGIVLLNSNFEIQYANDAALKVTGCGRAELMSKPYERLGLENVPSRSDIRKSLQECGRWTGEVKVLRKDGAEATAQAAVSTVTFGKDEVPDYILRFEDVTERKQAEAGMRLYASVFENGGEACVICDAENRMIAVNESFTRITGYTADEIVGRDPKILASGLTPPDTFRDMWSELQRVGYWQGEVTDRRKDGSFFPKWLSISVIQDPDGNRTHYVGSFTDISERKAIESRLAFLAHKDDLTGLLNRHSLQDRLAQALATANRYAQTVAVAFVDLDRFKAINDTLGHAAGDAVLTEVARRLRETLRESDILARIGGDEFVVALLDVEGPADVSHVAEKMLRALARPILMEGRTLHVNASIGLALYPGDGSDAETLIRNADTAMYHAKTRGRGNFQFFATEMNDAVVERLKIEQGLTEAMERGQFELHYQPKFGGSNFDLVGFEALVRWCHPQDGPISPGSFIPIAEETGMILRLGEWVIDEACRQLRVWRDEGFLEVSVAVNISARQLRSPDLPNVVSSALAKHGLRGADLELEITESVAMDDPDASVCLLEALEGLGVRLCIDDFGTGYSSLSYLKRLSVHTLKLDQSFVRDIERDPNDVAICAATIALAHKLGLTVVAEGIETEAQQRFLQSQGCDFLQGYRFGKPMPGADALKVLRRDQLEVRSGTG